ncbi:thiosulfate sulfurtransferase GlpE [Pseudomonas sp. TH31]|nr:thiosulfate sulfurtransferase GlpE [Pseudomonas sp. TH31]
MRRAGSHQTTSRLPYSRTNVSQRPALDCAFSRATGARHERIQTYPPEQAQALREQGAVVVDVRDPATFAALHISGSKHLDNVSISDFIRAADLDAPTVVVCYHGNSSQSAAAYLISQGFSDVYSMDGGFELWRTTYPAETAQGTAE